MPLTPALRWALLAYLLTGLVCGCSHRYSSQQSATRTEETRTEWQTAETAVENTQSVATEKKQGRRETRRFNPSGQLLEQVIEQWGSDGRVQVDTSGSSSRSATGADFSSVVAKSSSARQADTKAGLPSPLWLLLVIPAAVGAWALRRRIRSFMPFLG